jgi:alkylation response protein AidB-like acyl-CoA dehydrogenase
VDFDLTDEQQLLKDSVDRLMVDRYTFERRKGYQSKPEGWSRELWTQYAELGLLAMPFAEKDGGFGGGPVETMLVMEAFGRVLALEPYLSCVTLAGGVIRRAANEAQRQALIPKIAAGELLIALAHSEPQSRYDLFDVGASAKAEGEAFVLSGEKGLVLHGDSADRLIVSARTRPASRGAAIRHRTAPARRRFRLPACASDPTPSSAIRRAASLSSKASRTKPSPRSAPRRSGPCRRP